MQSSLFQYLRRPSLDVSAEVMLFASNLWLCSRVSSTYLNSISLKYILPCAQKPYTIYGVSLSLESSQSTISLVYPMSDSSCAFVNRNTVLTFNLSRTLLNLFDNSRTPYAISASCPLVSIRDWVADSFLITTPLSALVTSLMFDRLLATDVRDRRCFASR